MENNSTRKRIIELIENSDKKLSYRQIQKKLGLSSTSLVAFHLKKLKSEGNAPKQINIQKYPYEEILEMVNKIHKIQEDLNEVILFLEQFK